MPAAGERLRRLDEALQIIRSLFTEEVTDFAGEHYTVRGAMNAPKGVQRPHIPIMVAGGGEKVTLKLVARHADLCNMLAGPDILAHKYAVIDAHCEAIGRDPSEIRRTALTTCLLADTDEAAQAAFPDAGAALFDGDVRAYGLIGSPDTILERIDAYAAAGVDELIVGFAMPDIPAAIEQYAAIAAAGAGGRGITGGRAASWGVWIPPPPHSPPAAPSPAIASNPSPVAAGWESCTARPSSCSAALSP